MWRLVLLFSLKVLDCELLHSNHLIFCRFILIQSKGSIIWLLLTLATKFILTPHSTTRLAIAITVFIVVRRDWVSTNAHSPTAFPVKNCGMPVTRYFDTIELILRVILKEPAKIISDIRVLTFQAMWNWWRESDVK